MIFGLEFRWQEVGVWDGKPRVFVNDRPHVLQWRMRVSPIYAGADGNVHVATSDTPEWTQWQTVETPK